MDVANKPVGRKPDPGVDFPWERMLDKARKLEAGEGSPTEKVMAEGPNQMVGQVATDAVWQKNDNTT